MRTLHDISKNVVNENSKGTLPNAYLGQRQDLFPGQLCLIVSF